MTATKTLAALALTACSASRAAVDIAVQADSGRKAISPYIYGRNTALKASELPLVRESGIRIMRANDGNDATKYNWRNGLCSHPDWYNNVYTDDWDSRAKSIQKDLPGVQGMFAFQLLGWVADNARNNFNDWDYNQSSWWDGTGQNLAGGGTPDAGGGSKAATEGDPLKYLKAWPADSSAAIIDHWFGNGGLGLDSANFRYWSMDNEPDGWSGTHDDVVPALTGRKLTAEDYVQRYAAAAKAVRKKFPGARLVGPASMSEWQWYTWENEGVKYKGENLCFPEYLIKRLAEIQDSTAVRMLDVYDIHYYTNFPDAEPEASVLQTHRLLFDTTYANPHANGIKTVAGGWDESIKKEYVLLRIRRWLDRYFGPGNGIGVGMTESSVQSKVSSDASATAVWHASVLGTLAENGGELYTTWFWYPGMWEATHLFSRHAFRTRVASRSSQDSLVSAYSSISDAGDSMTVILVNRDIASARTANVSLGGFAPSGNGTSLQLKGLSGETFVSHAQNGLKTGSVTVSGSTFSLDLPALSVTAVRLGGKGNAVTGVRPRAFRTEGFAQRGQILEWTNLDANRIELRTASGALVRSIPVQSGAARCDLAGLRPGLYLATWPGNARKIGVAK